MSGEFSRDDLNGDGAIQNLNTASDDGNAEYSTPVTAERQALPPSVPPPPSGPPKSVEEVLQSDIGITTLLNRLKQSIASARDFAQFLKKRSTLEEEQATGLKRLAKAQLENVRKSDVRGGSFANQLADVFRVHERMGDNGMQFALSLHQMHEDLQELSNSMERGRKQWKHEGLDAEKKASDAESAMQKAKSRYDGLAEDYDRARTGDTRAGRRIGLKGPKSAEQHEQDLLRKTQGADADYEEKVRQAKAQREHLFNKARPDAVRALQELIRECDSALTLQLQKFATFNEKLLLGNGLAVSPLNDNDGPGAQRSLRDIVMNIDNEKDFHTFVGGHLGKITRPSDIKYEQHPTMAPKTQKPTQAPIVVNTQVSSAQPLHVVNNAGSQPGSTTNRYGNSVPTSAAAEKPYGQTPGTYPPSTSQPLETSQPPPNFAQQPAYNSNSVSSRDAYAGAPPYPVHPTERSTPTAAGAPSNQMAGFINSGPSAAAPVRQFSAPARPVFGVSLEELFNRDQSAVPMVVFQCMQAVDVFGLEAEGIYRVNGSTSAVNALRNAFDTLPPTAPQLDFRNPANFYQDVNVVTTLLKSFFRDLPDPLFTSAGYATFIDAARVENGEARRDALHQAINDLPDPNYATLRALVLHLHRVVLREDKTRMGSSNLAVCIAPSLMGMQNPTSVGDAALQAKVVDSILVNATAIFDED